MVVHSLNLFRFLLVVVATVEVDQANNKDQDHMEANSHLFQFRNQVEVMAANHHRGLPAMVVNQFRFLPAGVGTVEVDPVSNNKDLQDMVASNLLFRQFQFRN